ncbi:unnamed protein product [Clavelina lepadiformis]|uniref:Proteasome assembly chaperone 2 n=1 Tax=Clavelina lepadiformis TaxID=159417 RepID=A0ABP0GYY7_CLALP
MPSMLRSAPFRYLISPAHKDAKQCISQLSWKEMEERAVGYGDRSLFLPGGGYTKKLFQACCEAEVPCVVLLLFCAEGNNIPEAMSIVDHLNQWKHYIVSDLFEVK